MDLVDLDGVRVAYERRGDGAPLVLLHGYVGDGPATWRPQLDDLSQDFTVVAWDAPGAGRSEDPPEDIGMAGYATYLAEFVDALELRHPHIVGLSFGGALAIEFARQYPAIPRTLVLASAYAGWAGSLPPEAAQQRLQQALQLSELTPDQFVDTLLPTMFAAADPESIEGFGASIREFHPIGFRAMARASAEDLSEALPHISAPTLLIYGDKDIRAPLPVADALHAAIADSTLVVLPGAGHVSNIEFPDDFNATVRSFVRSHI